MPVSAHFRTDVEARVRQGTTAGAGFARAGRARVADELGERGAGEFGAIMRIGIVFNRPGRRRPAAPGLFMDAGYGKSSCSIQSWAVFKSVVVYGPLWTPKLPSYRTR